MAKENFNIHFVYLLKICLQNFNVNHLEYHDDYRYKTIKENQTDNILIMSR